MTVVAVILVRAIVRICVRLGCGIFPPAIVVANIKSAARIFSVCAPIMYVAGAVVAAACVIKANVFVVYPVVNATGAIVAFIIGYSGWDANLAWGIAIPRCRGCAVWVGIQYFADCVAYVFSVAFIHHGARGQSRNK